MSCHCANIIKPSKLRTQALISLEKNVLLMNPDTSNNVHDQLKMCCINCINSMSRDVTAELDALKYRKDNEALSIKEPLKLIQQFQEILPGTEDYRTVYDRFHPSGYTICRIEKNFNPTLFEEYSTHCKQEHEKLLFHGSQNMNYIKILTGGFDKSKSGNGLLGYGIYFAQHPSYSNGYARDSVQFKEHNDEPELDSGLDIECKAMKNMLLCRVSVHAAAQGADIWCVPHDRHCYPEYIIYYLPK
jgi:hypothetical protein